MRLVWEEKSSAVIMKLGFVLTALAVFVLLSVALNATRQGRGCMGFENEIS